MQRTHLKLALAGMLAVVGIVLTWREFFASWVCPGALRGEDCPWHGAGLDHLSGGGISYMYSQSFLARPQLWSGQSSADVSLLKPVW